MSDKKPAAAQQTALTTQQVSSPLVQGVPNGISANNATYRLPSDATLQHAAKLAVVEDKPIMMDYWTDSLDNKALIGIKENQEKLLVKSSDEYTSPIAKFYKSIGEYIIITENSIYIVSSEIPKKRIS